MELEGTYLTAFALTAFAGLSTGIGSALAFFADKTKKGFLAVALGFSAGVMIYVSFVEILQKSNDALTMSFGDSAGSWYNVLSFFGGVLLILLIDKLIPSYENPHEARKVEEMNEPVSRDDNLMRMGLFTALAIAIHNFPEGIATFTAAMTDPNLGFSIATAIAIHNIPEGIAVSVPIYFATGSRKKAFWLSFASGLSEPVGAIIGYIILQHFFTTAVFGVLFAAVAGIMVFISLDELLPTSREYDKGHQSIYGLVLGMAVMAVSLLLFM